MTTVQSGGEPLTLSFMGANYVARESGYPGGEDWGPFDAATNAAFQPINSYAERLEGLLGQIAAAGFESIDLWLAHLNWRWATREHILIARHALRHHGLRVATLAGNFGSTRSELEAACQLATALDVDMLGGMGEVLRADRVGAEAVLREHGVRFAYENHPESDPREVLDLIGDASDVLGVAIDTGWWATHGYDPVQAIRDLGDRLFYVHLKDVSRAGEPHLTCAHGEGVVDIPGCVDEILASGYAGGMSIEHEPYDHDPTAECARMLEAIEAQLADAKAAANG